MSKRAEEAAAAFHNQALLEAQKYAQSYGGGISQEVAYGRGLKTGFIEGYEQAEKDLALTWEDMVLLRTLFDATDANQSMGALTVQPMTREYYEYLLREFNEQRKK